MIYKISTAVLLLGLIFLGTRLKVSNDIADEAEVKTKELTDKVKFLEDKLTSVNDDYNYLLNQNASLIVSQNETKFTNSKPLIIYRNAEKDNINHDASEQYIELLSTRYAD